MERKTTGVCVERTIDLASALAHGSWAMKEVDQLYMVVLLDDFQHVLARHSACRLLSNLGFVERESLASPGHVRL